MISAFANTWKIPELRDRILFTLALIVIIRLGVHITLPGVDATVIKAWLVDVQKQDPTNPTGGITALLTVFSGGGLQQAGIFALGIMPYISASIMVQLMTAVVPKLSRLAREDGGRQKITQYTRYITIGIALVQGFFVAKSLTNPGNIPYMQGIERFGELVPDPSAMWMILTVVTIVAGTVLLMWIGDQMTEKGIGNGTSIIITVNIISALPGALIQAWKYFVTGEGVSKFNAIMMVVMIALLLVVIAATISITQAQRRIAVQYAKRVVGRKQFGGQTQYLPLKVNYAGVMPIIFASAVLSLPPMMLQWFFAGRDGPPRFMASSSVAAPGITSSVASVSSCSPILGRDDVPAIPDRRGSQAQRRLHSRRAPRQTDCGFPRFHDDPAHLCRCYLPHHPVRPAGCRGQAR
jgi:preprotein translocase subunit SecY